MEVDRPPRSNVPPQTGIPAIEVENVSFSYVRGREVLRDVNLALARGDFLALMGPNGSGKSTLLKLILGLYKPLRGSIDLFGQPTRKRKQGWRVGYVSQTALRFNPSFPATVREVVATGLCGKLGLFHSIPRWGWDCVDEALQQVGLGEEGKRMMSALSGGQQQRVLIARSLVADPELLILDEPTIGIDTKTTVQFYQLLHRLHQKKGVTLLLVTHDIGVISSTVQNVACLNRSLFFHGKREDFAENKDMLLSQTYGHAVRVVGHQHPGG
ncbi:metal ABC transporter ATP-binding protein [Pasteuria penetrans]|uniref:metal ABC transporter ATP-binding protein n=1 Tax=Pasteuria penetrans TaxID=86005 RepID=UPI000FB38F16|nr:metal ABC transporter ATP-binding protein [Pasteuria penetrans]